MSGLLDAAGQCVVEGRDRGQRPPRGQVLVDRLPHRGARTGDALRGLVDNDPRPLDPEGLATAGGRLVAIGSADRVR